MTKSKGVGRGGVRKGAGRRSTAAKVDWNAVAGAYFTGTETVAGICESFGVDYGELLAYATANHWCRPRSKGPHPDDLGDLASALAFEMFSVKEPDRRRCFVSAMVGLRARVADIAEILNIPESTLRTEFAKEVAGAR